MRVMVCNARLEQKLDQCLWVQQVLIGLVLVVMMFSFLTLSTTFLGLPDLTQPCLQQLKAKPTDRAGIGLGDKKKTKANSLLYNVCRHEMEERFIM